MNAPTAAFLGDGALRAARRALRRGRAAGPALLLIWEADTSPVGRRDAPADESAEPAGGTPALAERQPLARRRTRERVLASSSSANDILDAVSAHPGPVAVVLARPRDDESDRVLCAVDEVIAAVREPGGAYATRLEHELAAVARRLVVVPAGPPSVLRRLAGSDGQAIPVVMAAVAALMAVAVGLGLVASAVGRGAGVQGRADVAALAGAAALRDAQSALYDSDPGRRLTVAQVRARALAAARRTGQANGLSIGRIDFAGAPDLPTRVRVEAWANGPRPQDPRRRIRAVAEVVAGAGLPGASGAGEYPGPFATRQGLRMRPDVAIAFDRLARAARAAGHRLVIVSAYRSNAEQAELFRRNPNPRMVAPPGRSLHRLGTELDLGPASAYGWLGAHARRFGFLKRYSWEDWHFGYVANAGSASLGYRAIDDHGDGGASHGAVPGFVPEQYAGLFARAAQRWSVGAALLAAQAWQESRFNPRAISPAGAAGIAQFMPGTAALYGMSPADRFDPAKAINAQAHLMHDLLRQFGSVPLALAAYNAGPGRVRACGCVPAIPETQGYVQAILARLGGAGIGAAAGLELRLVA